MARRLLRRLRLTPQSPRLTTWGFCVEMDHLQSHVLRRDRRLHLGHRRISRRAVRQTLLCRGDGCLGYVHELLVTVNYTLF